jgi:hypothetical protein
MSRLPEHYRHLADDLWDGTVPSGWLPVRDVEHRTYWDWWRSGVIEGRAFGPTVTEASPGPWAAAYNAGIEYAARAMAAKR